MLMKATKLCKQKCYFLTFFCPADDLPGGGTLTDIIMCKRHQSKQVFLKQFHFLKPLDIFMTLLKQAKKVTLRDANEDVDKVCIRYKKPPTTQVENLHAVSHFTEHKTFGALNYAQDFGNRVMESLKRTTNSKWATLTKSRIVPCQILSCHCQHFQLCLSHLCKQ